MIRPDSLEPFTGRPRSSAVLALLLVLLGAVFVSGLVPTSPNRPYFAGHAWLLASACWVLAGFFAYCAMKSRSSSSSESKK